MRGGVFVVKRGEMSVKTTPPGADLVGKYEGALGVVSGICSDTAN